METEFSCKYLLISGACFPNKHNLIHHQIPVMNGLVHFFNYHKWQDAHFVSTACAFNVLEKPTVLFRIVRAC